MKQLETKVTPKREANKAWWVNGVFVIITHVIGLFSLLLYTPQTKTLMVTAVFFFLACMGITMGYHRLWSHRAYKATLPTKIVLCIMGTLGFQGSIRWWVLRHRIHHRWTDTEHDPYSAKKGFYFSHIGWIFKKPYYEKMPLIESSDLDQDPVVVFQHRFFPYLAIFWGFVVPSLICSFWGDALGGYLYGGIVCRLGVWHVTFCINSFAHWAGDQEFSTKMTARGNLFLALLTCGEGYHNFHHEFPMDYRNGVGFFDYDPTKWAIAALEFFGLAYDLKRTPQEEIEKAKIDILEAQVMKMKKQYDWGPSADKLPIIAKAHDSGYPTLAAYLDSHPQENFIIISSILYNVTKFKDEHPGGKELLEKYQGEDVTKMFYGGLNMHTDSAKRRLKMLAVAKVV